MLASDLLTRTSRWGSARQGRRPFRGLPRPQERYDGSAVLPFQRRIAGGKCLYKELFTYNFFLGYNTPWWFKGERVGSGKSKRAEGSSGKNKDL